MSRVALLSVLCLFVIGCSAKSAQVETTNLSEPPPASEEEAPATESEPAPVETSKVGIQLADVPFSPFDPAKPEGIQVYPLVGNPGAGAFNAIVKLPPGHTSPLHSHSASYSGVSLTEGHVHSLTAEVNEPLPAGSTWHQPAGEPHIDACRSEEPCLFLVFFDGAVDMVAAEAPAAEPKATINPADQMKWAEAKAGVMMSVIHGNPKEGPFHAVFDFPAGMTTNVHTHSASFSGGLLSGTHHRGPSPDGLRTLTAGAVWHEASNSPHMEKCGEEQRCVFAGAMNGAMDTSNVELNTTKE